MDVGFIGLGNMGAGIAAKLLKPGRRLKVWNRSQEPVSRLVAQGAETAASPAEALGADITFSMLANDEAFEAVIVESGALERARKGLVHVNLATMSVDLARWMADRHEALGLGYVAAPVLGRPDVAAAGQLNGLCAGGPAAVALARPLLQEFTRAVWPLGDDPVRANVVKLACNFALASMIETLGEAGALAAVYGVEPADLFEIMTGTLFAAPAYRTYADIIASARFIPAGFMLPLGLKDVRLALQAAEARNAALPIASLLRDHFIEGIANGDGDKDWAALAEGAFRRAGRTLETSSPSKPEDSARAKADRNLDEALEEFFPASDPIAP